MRLIDANEALRMMKDSKADDPFCDSKAMKFAWELAHDCAKSCVDACPTVEAVPVVHGRWEVIEASDGLYKCSVCGEWQFIPEEHFAYCPYCGAKMDGGADNA